MQHTYTPVSNARTKTKARLGGRFINLVNLGLIVCTDSYVEKALPECDGTMDRRNPHSAVKVVDGKHIGNKSAVLAFQKY
eukprot:scaffold586_cov77-Skeletonema_marinoi.AAC.1